MKSIDETIDMAEEKQTKHIYESECREAEHPSSAEKRMTKYKLLPSQQNISLPSHFKWNTLKALFDDPEGLKLFNRYIQTKEALWNITKSSYLNFLQSDICVQYIRERTIEVNEISNKDTDENVSNGQPPTTTDQNNHTPNKIEISLIHNRQNTYTSRLSHLKWDTLKGLLDDPEGSELFHRYVQTEEALWTITKTSYHNFFHSDMYTQHIQKPIVKVASVSRKCTGYSVQPSNGGGSIQTIGVVTAAYLRNRSRKFDADKVSIATSLDNRPDQRKIYVKKTRNEVPKELPMNKINEPIYALVPRLSAMKTEQSPENFLSQIIPKLESIHYRQLLEEQDQLIEQTHSTNNLSIEPMIPPTNQRDEPIGSELQLQDNGQSILDQHVSRVWIDPLPPIPAANCRCSNNSVLYGDSPILKRNSKSMIRHTSSFKQLSNKWPSMDSGKSSKYPIIGSSCYRYTVVDSTPKLNESQKPELPSSSSTSTQSTVAVFKYVGEEFPYRSKIPGLMPTLRQFKEYLPKEGNFRFFFKTTCDDPDNPVLQEEIFDDDEVLPLFNGEIMAFIKRRYE